MFSLFELQTVLMKLNGFTIKVTGKLSHDIETGGVYV